MRLLIFGLLAFLSLEAKAVESYYTSHGSATIHAISISSASGAVQLDNTARRKSNRIAVEVYNDDSSNPLFCGFNSSVSSSTVTGLIGTYGRRIAPRVGVTWAVPISVNIYCRSSGDDSAAGTAVAVFTQIY